MLPLEICEKAFSCAFGARGAGVEGEDSTFFNLTPPPMADNKAFLKGSESDKKIMNAWESFNLPVSLVMSLLLWRMVLSLLILLIIPPPVSPLVVLVTGDPSDRSEALDPEEDGGGVFFSFAPASAAARSFPPAAG